MQALPWELEIYTHGIGAATSLAITVKYMKCFARLQALSGTHIEIISVIARLESTKWTLHGQAVLICQRRRGIP